MSYCYHPSEWTGPDGVCTECAEQERVAKLEADYERVCKERDAALLARDRFCELLTRSLEFNARLVNDAALSDDIFALAAEQCEQMDAALKEREMYLRVMCGLLKDAERQVEEQAAELVAAQNEQERLVAHWKRLHGDTMTKLGDLYDNACRERDELRETLTRERKVGWRVAEEMWDVRDAAADYHAAWQDAQCAECNAGVQEMHRAKLHWESIAAKAMAEKAQVERARDEFRQGAWWWRDVAQRVFREWNPKGDEYDHYVKHAPELGRDYWHLMICSKQCGPISECPVCRDCGGQDWPSETD